jgi:hypothetical protein
MRARARNPLEVALREELERLEEMARNGELRMAQVGGCGLSLGCWKDLAQAKIMEVWNK